MTPPIDDPETLRRILANTDALLMDFDGPICKVFAGIPAHVVAEQLRDVLAEGGHTQLPGNIQAATDPFDILFYAATLGEDEARYVEAAFRAHEVEAVHTARPTPGAQDLIHEWRAANRPLAVVSNNSSDAIRTYLSIHGLLDHVDVVAARIGPEVEQLKPHPFLLISAALSLATSLSRCTLFGDSVADIQAARAGGVAAIAYANRVTKAASLLSFAPATIVTNLDIVIAEVRALPPGIDR